MAEISLAEQVEQICRPAAEWAEGQVAVWQALNNARTIQFKELEQRIKNLEKIIK